MLKAGFIGFGRMGITHFSILNTHPGVEIVSVCDKSSTMLGLLDKHLEINIYSDHMKMLDDSDVDLVVVSTPPDSHYEIIRQAIEKGIHVFVEKPMTLTQKESEQVVALLKDKKIVNQVGYVNRFNEVFTKIKQLLDARLLGEVKNFSSEMYGSTVVKDSGDGWRGRKNAGGGCLYEFATHCIDLAVYLFGMPTKVVGSYLQSIYSSQVEDIVSSNFLYDSGIAGNIYVNWSDASCRKPTNIVKVFGTNGRIIADKHAYKVYLKKAAPEFGLDPGWNTRYITDFAAKTRFYLRGNEFTEQLDYFIASIVDGRNGNVCGFSEALKVDTLIEWITQDAERSVSCDVESRVQIRALAPGKLKISFLKRLLGKWRQRNAASNYPRR